MAVQHRRTYMIRGLQFFPLLNFPRTNFYHLNDSQLQAFQAALTQEFCIIQGPPGTGKTFLGLKIAKTLLENYKAWYKKSPMLVICYTNHALDQFLEGLTDFTSKIIRVGGQSKNEKLSSFNLRNRHRCKMSPAFYEKRDEVKIIGTQIKNVTENFKQINFYNSIRAFDAFEEVVPNFDNSWFSRVRRDDILDWLLQRREELPRAGTTQNPNRTEESEEIDSVQGEDNNDEELEEDTDSEDVSDGEHIDDLFDELNVMAVQCSIPILTTSSLRQKMEMLQNTVQDLRQNENPTTEQFIEEEKCNFELFKVQNEYDYLNMKLAEGKVMMKVETPRHVDLNNPYNMSPDDRWNLYFYWLNLYKEKLKEKLDLLNNRFRDIYKIYEEMRDIENTNSMKDALVIGMTTTGAARLRSSLQALKSPVVIVEEAAEVLEAHIVASLTKHCQHLILIGDHQQLKPSTSNYKIERFYKLGISLFERMVINETQLYTLNIQHRMKPEISSLITPTIYPSLEDHPSVTQREPIRGLDNCLFFIDHTHPEDNCDGTSKKNRHEVEFLIHFAKHLILNGYKPENITILAAYLGQMFEMQKEKKKHMHVLGKVRIAVLDNYQGEECDIILLSLVRSNKENKIGFLSIENRVCVALSRARNGFYIMGNMTQLCAASELWQKIRRTLEEQNAIGTELALRCQVHSDRVTYVKTGDDIVKHIPEGGCSQRCGAALVCGHKCTSLCHILNRDHKDYKCRETCNKQLCDADPLHLCKKMCFVECGPCAYLVQRSLACGHTVSLECHIDLDTYQCVVPVSTQLPCGHVADKPCHRDAQSYRCPHPCDVKVEPCGHACSLLCHIRRDPDHLEYQCRKKCARYRKGCTMETDDHLCRKFCYEECEPCTIPVRKRRTICPHVYDVPCSSDVDEIICKKPCTKTLPCNHKCKSKCFEPCRKCELKVEKINPVCGHTIKVKCCEEPDRKLCNKKCPLKLPCGHACTKKCNETCTTTCREMVSCLITAPCGHKITQVLCSVANSVDQQPKILLKYCNHPCGKELKCGHSCSGTCGECRQGRVHKRCSKKCGFPLVCNHPCSFPCRQACRPCDLPCPYKCKHSSCGKKCGDVCTPCKERCTRSCRHQQCTKFCGQICNVPPCNKPCDKALKCGHRCIGFCGDPCPPKCLVCDREELTTIFFGDEDEENARFVLLVDCGHVFESIGMKQWMEQDEDKICFKECPGCKTPIKTTQRYYDFIKKSMGDVATVKKNFHGTPQEIERKRQELRDKLLLLKGKCINLELPHLKLDEVLQIIENRLQVEMNGKRQPINKPVLNAVHSKLQIIEHALNLCEKGNISNLSTDICIRQVRFITEILIRQEDYITDQEIDDVQYELNRLSRIVEFGKIKKSRYFVAHFSSSNSVRRNVDQIEQLLHSLGKFFDEDEEKVKQLLTTLSKSVASGIGISEKERREIVQAIGLKQGHWYKCPNGHPYAIGECGGAMQESTCPECGAKIGGTGHRLQSGNAVATEMDGAAHGAWSEAANMANYRL